MKQITAIIWIGLLAGGLLCGCARDRSKPAGTEAGPPPLAGTHGTAWSSAVANPGGTLYYQWCINPNILMETNR